MAFASSVLWASVGNQLYAALRFLAHFGLFLFSASLCIIILSSSFQFRYFHAYLFGSIIVIIVLYMLFIKFSIIIELVFYIDIWIIANNINYIVLGKCGNAQNVESSAKMSSFYLHGKFKGCADLCGFSKPLLPLLQLWTSFVFSAK